MNKKHSILFQITIFFIIILIVINLLVIIKFILDKETNKIFNMKRYYQSTMIIHDSYFKHLDNNKINEKLKPFYTSVSTVSLSNLRRYANKIVDDKGVPIVVFSFDGYKYIYAKEPFMHKKEKGIRDFPPPFDLHLKKIIFRDNIKDGFLKFIWLFILFIIDFLLIWFFYFLYKKLSPLQQLKNEIAKFSSGDLNINTKSKGKDEISQVSNEFNNAIIKIRELEDSRKLFLRNILHELKTPITKGKLVSDTLEKGKKRDILQKAFLRLEYLLEEFVKIERLISGKLHLDKKEYRVIDLLDQALDILLIDKNQIELYPNNTKILVDFELFSIALKNLIDNAMKYNTKGKPQIVIKEDSLLIKNIGKPLKNIFEEYLKPFNREYESIDKGLGLGLYISNSVIESHNYKLYYFYNANYHILKIDFRKI